MELNLNFEKTFDEFFRAMQEGEKQEFFSNPVPHLNKLGIPFVSSFDSTGIEITVDFSDPLIQSRFFEKDEKIIANLKGAQCRVTTSWWGINFIFNKELTDAVVLGLITVIELSEAVALACASAGVAVPAQVAAIAFSAFAVVCLAKALQIKYTDNGKGVYFPITWIQWSSIIASASLGPGTLVPMIAAVVHPFPN